MTSKEELVPVGCNIDIEQLILLVQERPALWDMRINDYSDRIKRKQCWEEITQIFGSDLSLENKKKLGDILHKKWKNVRDRYAREVQDRKGKSGDGAHKKSCYMYAQQLEFLKDTVTPKKTVTSLKRTVAESAHQQEPAAEETEVGEEEEEPVRLPVGKKRLHPVEEKILQSLDRYDKRQKMQKEKQNDEQNDNRHFLLSLVPSLSMLPRQLNTRCRIELLQCIERYETMSQQRQQPPIRSAPTTSYHQQPQYSQQQQQQQESNIFQPIHHSSYATLPLPTPSPVESNISTYFSSYPEDDSTG